MLNIGDKVKFLNEEGGGIVSKIINNKLVYVSVEDGFEIPTMVIELIKIEEEKSTSSASMFVPEYNLSDEQKQLIQQEKKTNAHRVDEHISKLNKKQIKQEAGVGLYFVPDNQKMLITGKISLYIINSTDNDVLYNLFIKEEDGFKGADYGAVPSNSKIIVKEIDRDHLKPWLKGSVQLMFHPNKSQQIPDTMNLDYSLKQNKFYKEDNYQNYSSINELAVGIELYNTSMSPIEKNIPRQRLTKQYVLVNKHRVDDDTIKVDLHIENLKEKFIHLRPQEIFKIQMSYFERCITDAVLADIKNIIIIHGVGNGILKAEIRKQLKEYSFTFEDAPISEYGVGATVATNI